MSNDRRPRSGPRDRPAPPMPNSHG